MACGQVVYASGTMETNRVIYNGHAAQEWPMHIEGGKFPNESYKITEAVIQFDVRTAYGAGRHMVIQRETGEQLGDVPTTATGMQEQKLLTTPSYAGIISIRTDGEKAPACILRGGSCIRIIVTWETTLANVMIPCSPWQPAVFTGKQVTGRKESVMHTDAVVTFDGVDISKDINTDLLSLSYTDNEEDEADDLQIKLQDRAKKWLGRWLNDTLTAASNGINNANAIVSPEKEKLVCNGFINSVEFQGKGYSNAQIVEMLYGVILGRHSDPGGLASWTAMLNAGTPVSTVIDGFISSAEFQNKQPDTAKDFVNKCYKIFLGRNPDPGGYDSWMAVIGAGSSKGLTIAAGVKKYDTDGTINSGDFGFFELDQIRSSGPPSNILIKGTSLPFSNGIRTEERDKSWEGYTLKRIGQEIAGNGGLGFMYDCPDDPPYERVEQAKQTDIAFLQQLCHDNGKSLKIFGFKLIIFDQARYEALKPVTTIKWKDGSYTKYDLSTQNGETHYDQCVVTYFDAASGVTYEGSANADDYNEEAKEHTVCTVTNRKVGSAAEAADLAKKILRLHNKYEKRVSFTLVGSPLLCAGLTMQLSGFGLWDEKYIIKQCRHEVSNSGYTTRVTLRSIPEGKVSVVKAEEEKKEESSGGGSSNNQPRKQVQKAWYTDATIKVYNDKTGDAGTRWIGKDVEVKVLGNTKDGRTLIQYGKVQGYVNTADLTKKEKKSTGTGKKQ